MCRYVCTGIIELQPKFIGTKNRPVQIDESFFSGRRKYNRNRIRNGDVAKLKKNDDVDDDDDFEGCSANRHDGALYNEDTSDWLWVVGMKSSNQHVRFVHVKNRTQETLKNVIRKYVSEGSVVWTDSFSAYNSYSLDAYVHETMIHAQHFEDPDTGAHTQGQNMRGWTLSAGTSEHSATVSIFRAI